MARLLGKYARLYLDHMPIYLKSYEMDTSISTTTVDASVYGDDFDQFDVLTYKGQFNLTARLTNDYRNPDDTDDQLLDKFFREMLIDPATNMAKTTPANMSLLNTGAAVVAAGNTGLFTRGWGNMGMSFPRNNISAIKCQFTEHGAISRGPVIGLFDVTLDSDGTPPATWPSPLTGTGILVGNPSNFLRAIIHVTSYTVVSGSPTGVTAKVYSGTTVDMGSSTEQLAFTAFTKEGSEWKDLTDPSLIAAWGATHDYINLQLAVTGTGSVTIQGICLAETG